MPFRVHRKLFHEYSLENQVQANSTEYNSTHMTVIGSHVLHHRWETLIFIITDLEASVLLSCADTLSLLLLQPIDKVSKKLPSVAKLITSQLDRYDVHIINTKITVCHHLTTCHNLIQVPKWSILNKIFWDFTRLFSRLRQVSGWTIPHWCRPKCTTHKDSL